MSLIKDRSLQEKQRIYVCDAVKRKKFCNFMLSLHSIDGIYRAKSFLCYQNTQKEKKSIDITKSLAIISPSIEQRMIEARLTLLTPFEATGIAG